MAWISPYTSPLTPHPSPLILHPSPLMEVLLCLGAIIRMAIPDVGDLGLLFKIDFAQVPGIKWPDGRINSLVE